ncbi:hypothetical protein Tco_0428837 [Tanacetum coccineum]
MSGNYGTSNAGSDYVGGVRIVTSYIMSGLMNSGDFYRRASKTPKYVFWRGFDDVGLRYFGGHCIRLKMYLDRPGGSAIGIMGFQRFIRSLGGRVVEHVFNRSMFHIEMRLIEFIAKSFILAPHIEFDECQLSESTPLIPLRRLTIDSVSAFKSGFARGGWCIKDCMEKNLEDDAGEILGVHSQGDCGNVTTDDNEDVTPVIAPEKDSIIVPPSTPSSNDLNIADESGSFGT